MLYLASIILTALYVALPAGLLVGRVVRARRTGRWRPVVGLAGVGLWGLAIGVGLTLAYAHAADARAPVSQMLLTSYFAAGMLLVLRGLNAALSAAGRTVRARTPLRAYLLASAFALGRVTVLFAIGLPYVMSVIMVYRPKVEPRGDPGSQFGVNFETVTFRATDGGRVAGWWVPSPSPAGDRASATVIVCHGLGSNKSNHLALAREAVDAGYNVLAIDLRAHGASGGQVSTFGDAERHDVLGAVRWVTAAHPARARRVYGLGASMGAAALLAAAGDASAEGQRIDAVAVYGTYDRLGGLAGTVFADQFPPPLGWLLRHVGVPVASLHTGRDLAAFAPADAAQRLWPRPLMVVHGTEDEFIRFEHGQRLYLQALQPKTFRWVQRGTHNGIVDDEGVAKDVIEFFDGSRSLL